MKITLPEVKDFITKVQEMRKAQKSYFNNNRSSYQLEKCKALEREVDHLAEKYSPTKPEATAVQGNLWT